MLFTDSGVLQAGILDFTFSSLYENFVTKFPTSQRRKTIYGSLVGFLKRVSDVCDIEELWLDGSYATNKVNPNDADILLFFSIENFIKLGPLWPTIRSFENIDAYCAVVIDEHTKQIISQEEFCQITNNRNYWRGQFGFDRNDHPKGIIRIKKDGIHKLLEGGDSDGSNVD